MLALKAVVASLSPDCRQVAKLQSAALDKNLSRTRRWGVRIHLLLCKWCRRYGKNIRFLRETMHVHPETLTPPPSGHLTPEARERMKRLLRK